MRHVNLDTQNESIKQFVLALASDPGGAILELNGQEVARVFPGSGSANGGSEDVWTQAKNERRCDLIDREIDGTLGADEAEELRRLQEEMLRYRRRVAPLPLEATRRLHQELLARAQAAGK